MKMEKDKISSCVYSQAMKRFNFVDLFAPGNLNNVSRKCARYEAPMPSNSTRVQGASQNHIRFLQLEENHPLHDDDPHTMAIQPQVVSHDMLQEGICHKCL
jgi:hypothetical protein